MENTLTVADLKAVGFRKSRGYFIQTTRTGVAIKVVFAVSGSTWFLDEVKVYESLTPKTREHAEQFVNRFSR